MVIEDATTAAAAEAAAAFIAGIDVAHADADAEPDAHADSAPYMMASLSNKNKRRGYKVPPAVLPGKITFGAPSSAGAAAAGGGAQEWAAPRPRLIPPSERAARGELPPRVVVTSVDVEADVDMGRRKKKKKARVEYGWGGEEEGAQGVEEGYGANGGLDYGGADGDGDVGMDQEADEGVFVPAQREDAVHSGGEDIDWEEAERRWEHAVPVTRLESLKPGVLVGWKVIYLFLSPLPIYHSPPSTRRSSPSTQPPSRPNTSSISPASARSRKRRGSRPSRRSSGPTRTPSRSAGWSSRNPKTAG
jgi:hypothetical protein